jgi:hypothetical protein
MHLWANGRPTSPTLVVPALWPVDFPTYPSDTDYLYYSGDGGATWHWRQYDDAYHYWSVWFKKGDEPLVKGVLDPYNGPCWRHYMEFDNTTGPLTVRFEWHDDAPIDPTSAILSPSGGTARDADVTSHTEVWAIGVGGMLPIRNVPPGVAAYVFLAGWPTPCEVCQGWPIGWPTYGLYRREGDDSRQWLNGFCMSTIAFSLRVGKYYASTWCGGSHLDSDFFCVGVGGLRSRDDTTTGPIADFRVAQGDHVSVGAVPSPSDAQPSGGASSLWPDGWPQWDGDGAAWANTGDTTVTLYTWNSGDKFMRAQCGSGPGSVSSATFHVVAVDDIEVLANGTWQGTDNSTRIFVGPDGSVDLLATSTLRRAWPDGWPVGWPTWRRAQESVQGSVPVTGDPPDRVHFSATGFPPDRYHHIAECGTSGGEVVVSVLGLETDGVDCLAYHQQGDIYCSAVPSASFGSGGQYLWTSLAPGVVRFLSDNPTSPTAVWLDATATTTCQCPHIVGMGPGYATLQVTYVSDPDDRGITASATAQMDVTVFQLTVSPDVHFLAVDDTKCLTASIAPCNPGGTIHWDSSWQFCYYDEQHGNMTSTDSNPGDWVTIKGLSHSDTIDDAYVTATFVPNGGGFYSGAPSARLLDRPGGRARGRGMAMAGLGNLQLCLIPHWTVFQVAITGFTNEVEIHWDDTNSNGWSDRRDSGIPTGPHHDGPHNGRVDLTTRDDAGLHRVDFELQPPGIHDGAAAFSITGEMNRAVTWADWRRKATIDGKLYANDQLTTSVWLEAIYPNTTDETGAIVGAVTLNLSGTIDGSTSWTSLDVR